MLQVWNFFSCCFKPEICLIIPFKINKHSKRPTTGFSSCAFPFESVITISNTRNLREHITFAINLRQWVGSWEWLKNFPSTFRRNSRRKIGTRNSFPGFFYFFLVISIISHLFPPFVSLVLRLLSSLSCYLLLLVIVASEKFMARPKEKGDFAWERNICSTHVPSIIRVKLEKCWDYRKVYANFHFYDSRHSQGKLLIVTVECWSIYLSHLIFLYHLRVFNCAKFKHSLLSFCRLCQLANVSRVSIFMFFMIHKKRWKVFVDCEWNLCRIDNGVWKWKFLLGRISFNVSVSVVFFHIFGHFYYSPTHFESHFSWLISSTPFQDVSEGHIDSLFTSIPVRVFFLPFFFHDRKK